MQMKDTHNNIANICNSMGLKYDCLSSGPLDASIAIISDYPGVTEKATGVPFSGSSGRMLWTMLKKYGLTRDKVYTTNVVKRVLSTHDDSDTVTINPNEFALWKDVLRSELAALNNLKYILCLGSNPLSALHNKQGITNWRGSVLIYEDKLTLISFNPAYVMRKDKRTGNLSDPRNEVIYTYDLAKFNKLINGKYVSVDVDCEIITTMDEFDDAIEYLEDRRVKSPISLDIEHLNEQTSCIGLCGDAVTGFVMPFFDPNGNLWDIKDEIQIRNRLSDFIQHKDTRILGQNVSTDLCWLWFKDNIGPIPNVWGDTLLAHHALYPTLPHNLAFLTSIYTWHPYYKSEGTSWKINGDVKEYYIYNAKDTVNTYNIHKQLLRELEAENLLDLYKNHIMRATKYLCTATVIGIPIDTELKKALEVEYTKDFEEMTKEYDDYIYTNHGIHVLGDKGFPSTQKLNVLFDELEVPILKRTPKGKRSTDETAIKRMVDSRVVSEEAKDIARRTIAIREKGKFLSTYAKVSIDYDNRFRTHYNQFGTQTAPGRLSSSQTQWGTGSNVQNQPNKSRTMFITLKDYVFVYIDGAQAEARFVGWDAKIDKWKHEFELARLNPGSFDCHRSLASRIFKIPLEQVPHKDWTVDNKPTIRYLGKRARHGLNYRMGPHTFSEKVNISLATAHNIYDAYHRDTPELKIWWKRLEHEIRDTKKKFGKGILTNTFGRRLCFLERLTDASMESAVAFRPQSHVGDLLTYVWYMSENDDEWPTNAKIIINVHDSLTAIAHHSVAKTVLKIMIKHAETPFMVQDDPLIIPADGKISVPDEYGIHRWSNLKSVQL